MKKGIGSKLDEQADDRKQSRGGNCKLHASQITVSCSYMY